MRFSDSPACRRVVQVIQHMALPVGLLATNLIVGCAALPGPDRTRSLSDAIRTVPFVLLGEVHDNALGHERRLAAIRALPALPSRALVFEQFDAARQADIDAWRLAQAPARGAAAARSLAQAAGFDFRGWQFAFYQPLLELALDRGWAIHAGNLSRSEAMAVATGQQAAPVQPAGWDEPASVRLQAAVRDGHCALLPASRLSAMALAQRSRDARIAQVMRAARAAGAQQVVLIAGNQHVRRDYGVARHLAAERRSNAGHVISVGFVESLENLPADAFDLLIKVPAQVRADPCESLRRRFARPEAG